MDSERGRENERVAAKSTIVTAVRHFDSGDDGWKEKKEKRRREERQKALYTSDALFARCRDAEFGRRESPEARQSIH